MFDLTAQPASPLVIGGCPIGYGLAQAFARIGTRTLIAHSEPLFLPKEERDGAEIHLNARVVEVRVEGGKKYVKTLNEANVVTI